MPVRASARRAGQRGYAMAALLVALGAMAVFASVAMPVWRTVVQREKEEELIFRGQQYVRAIRLFQRKFANAYPPSVDLLVEQRFLRKKYKDPITGGDFVIVYQNMIQQSRPAASGQGLGGRAGEGAIGGRAGEMSAPSVGTPQIPLANLDAAGPRGGIAGVVSKSTAKSIRVYNGRSAYNEWQFIFVQVNAPGQGGAGGAGRGRGGGPGALQPGGGRGGPQGGRGQGARGGGPGGGRGFGGGRGPGGP